MTTCNTTTFPTEAAVADIRVGDRHRKDLGDLVPLIKSIRDLGLLHPLVVTPDMQLVAGRRRLEAVRELGCATVPVHVVERIDDALAALRAESEENTCRKDFSPSEAVAIGKALEELKRAEAKKRQGQAGPQDGQGKKASGSGNLPEAVKGDTRDNVAEAVNMSGRTYEKAKDVVEAAEQEPEKYGDLAEQMDQTGKVDPAHKELKRRGGGKGKKKLSTGKGKKKPKEKWVAVDGAVTELNAMGAAGELSQEDLSPLANLPDREQSKLVKAGADAIKAKAADLRWLVSLPDVRLSPESFDPGAEVSEDARREALEKLNAALADLQQSRDTIAGWIATLKQKLGAGHPEAEQPCSTTAPST
jgi:ParB family chromosome partitioning protein